MKITALLVLLAIPSSSWAQATRSASLQLDAPVTTTLDSSSANADPFLLQLTPPTYKRWYFWAGITLSVVTTVVTALALTYLAVYATAPPVTAGGCAACDACIGSSCR